MTSTAETTRPTALPASSAEASVLPKGYALHTGYPPIPVYLHLRAASGLTPKTPAQAAPIAHNSWYGCYVTFTPIDDHSTPATSSSEEVDSNIVAMGRIVGDGGWYFHIADMAVLPAHQRRGLGDAVLKHLMAHIRAHAPRGEGGRGGAYVSLLADAPGRRLYARNGFVETAPRSVGMMMPMGWEGEAR